MTLDTQEAESGNRAYRMLCSDQCAPAGMLCEGMDDERLPSDMEIVRARRARENEDLAAAESDNAAREVKKAKEAAAERQGAIWASASDEAEAPQ